MIVGLVLAGGRSLRFGADKALASLGGRTLLEIAVARLGQVCTETAVSAPLGGPVAALAERLGLAVLDDPPAADAWHVLPLAAIPTWDALASVLDSAPSSLDALRSALDEGVPAPDPGAAAAAYEAVLGEAAKGWPAFVGLADLPSRHVALNFLAVAEAQRGARSQEEGVAVGFPLGEPNNPELQHRVIAAALRLLERNDLPVLENFEYDPKENE